MTAPRAIRTNSKKHLTVLLVDDQREIRKALRKILDAEGDIQVVGEAVNGKQAVEMAMKLRPSVVVMDIAMPKLNGLEATCQIRQSLAATQVLICSTFSDEAYVKRAMGVGAAGYINKLTSANDLVAAIRAVQKGKALFSPAVAEESQ